MLHRTIPVLFEDADILAVDKPAGVTVIPARDEPPEASLRRLLEDSRAQPLWVVHRLDRDTSGVVLFAQNAESHRALSLAFERHDVRKQYVAWTKGAMPAASGLIATSLHTARKGKMRPAHDNERDSLPCTTAYSDATVFKTASGPASRVTLSPRTGRQHQLRVHLRSVGAPLLVDPLYANVDALAADALGPGSPAITRHTLHATQITFAHPREARSVTISAPIAPDLAALDAWLESLGAR